jgi:hypothetical protein
MSFARSEFLHGLSTTLADVDGLSTKGAPHPALSPWQRARLRRCLLPAPGLSPSQGPHEGHQIALLLGGKIECKDQIEELDRIFEGQAPAVMEVRRALLDAAQRKRLDRP